MTLKIYVVTDSKGQRSLVKAHTNAGALKFKREQFVMDAKLATQQDLVELIGVVPVEAAATEAQAYIEDAPSK